MDDSRIEAWVQNYTMAFDEPRISLDSINYTDSILNMLIENFSGKGTAGCWFYGGHNGQESKQQEFQQMVEGTLVVARDEKAFITDCKAYSFDLALLHEFIELGRRSCLLKSTGADDRGCDSGFGNV
jgi:hypothetical protein